MKTFSSKSFLLLAAICISYGPVNGQSSKTIGFKQHIITTTFTNGYDVYPGDINQDGHMDVAAVGKGNGGEVAWFEGDNYYNYTKHSIRTGFTGARGVRIADLNGDGEMDVIAAAWEANKIICWLNDGNEAFTEWTIDDDFIGAHTLDIKDVNQDGYMDVLCSGFDYYGHNGEVAWWENINNTSFVKHLITDRFQQSPFVFCEDIDNDSDMDVLACGELNDEVCWYENDGSQSFAEHMVDNQFTSAHTVFARDLNDDDHMEILGAACLSSKMAWWSNDGNQNFTKFNLPAYAGALWLDAADLDMDGDMDMYGCGMSVSTISWWENDGLMNFTKHNLTESFPSAFAVWAMDMDYDTDLDLVCIGNQSGRISWFENQLLQPSLFYHPEGIVYDHANSRYFVSNTCGVDSMGSIIQLTLDMQQSVFIPGIEDPLGMYLKGDTLLVSHADYGVVGYDVNTGDSLFGVPIYPTGNSDGMTCDNSNHLYVLDTYGKMHKINLQDLSRIVLVSGGMGSWPQDCVYDPFNDRILVAPFGQDASIYSIDPETGEVTEATTTAYGRFDGINIDTDGNVYLSTHYSTGYVIKYDNSLTNPPEVLSTGHNEPAGNCYNPYDQVLAVANFGGNSVSFIPLTTTGGTGNNMEKPGNLQMKGFPNPCTDHTIIQFSLDHSDQLYFRVLDVNGKILVDDELGTKAPGYHSMKINTEGMASGVYYCVLSGNNIHSWHKMLVK